MPRPLSIQYVLLLFLVPSLPLAASTHADWPSYQKANRYACPGPFDTLEKVREFEYGGRKFRHEGAVLHWLEQPGAKNTSRITKIGVLGAIKDVSAATQKNVEESFAWFESTGVEVVVANGDLALDEYDLHDAIEMILKPGLPVIVTLGNSESVGSFARQAKKLEAKYPNFINGVYIRNIKTPKVDFWTLSGYYDRAFVHKNSGCRYKDKDLQAMKKKLQKRDHRSVVLISHGPPKGRGPQAIDRVFEKKNVGDPMLQNLIEEKGIRFGIFGHILEAGGRASKVDGKTRVKEGQKSSSLLLNAGSVSGAPWRMLNDKPAYGMAVVMTLEGDKAYFETKRFAYQDLGE